MEAKKYQYADKVEQLCRLNKDLCIFYSVYYLCVSILCALYTIVGIRSLGFTGSVIVLSAVFIVLNIISYVKNHASERLKYFAFIQAQFMVFLTGFAFDSYYIRFLSVIPLVAGLFYYNRKFVRVTAIVTIIMNFIVTFLRFSQGKSDMESLINEIMATLCISILMILILVMENVVNDFNSDELGKAKYDNELQEKMMQDVVDVAREVNLQTNDAMNMVRSLSESSTNVSSAMRGISESTENTVESIQSQSAMTQNIQAAIQTTKQSSDDMVHLAKESEELNAKSLEIMNKLQEQSQLITDTNAEVSDTMERLQEKAEDVKGIADSIFDISSKTNLLALNASIESARAGEAGRGFAVVADEIRKLAEQTRKETENIASILDELSENAVEAGKVVDQSVEMTKQQDAYILEASESFRSMDENVATLTEKIDEMDHMVEELSTANDQIVSSITSVSETTEQVSSAAGQAVVRSEENVEGTDGAMGLLTGIVEVARKLDNYEN